MASPIRVKRIAQQKALKYHIPASVFLPQIKTESGYNDRAVSPAGAQGAGQLMPGTARALGVKNPFDAAQNLEGAAKYDAQLLKEFHGNLRKALAAYNAGPGNLSAGLGYADKILGGRNVAPVAPARYAAPQAPQAPAVAADNRRQIALSLLGLGNLTGSSYTGGSDPLTSSLLQAVQKAQRGPAPQPQSYGTPSMVRGALGGSPIAGEKAHSATHPTEGLPGYPAYDYMAKAGTPVVAPVSGKIIRFSGHDPKIGPTQGPHGPFGWSIYLQGSDGKTYYLTHLGARDVRVGQTVKQGSVIGAVGNYAKYGTPSHVHMGVHG